MDTQRRSNSVILKIHSVYLHCYSFRTDLPLHTVSFHFILFSMRYFYFYFPSVFLVLSKWENALQRIPYSGAWTLSLFVILSNWIYLILSLCDVIGSHIFNVNCTTVQNIHHRDTRATANDSEKLLNDDGKKKHSTAHHSTEAKETREKCALD